MLGLKDSHLFTMKKQEEKNIFCLLHTQIKVIRQTLQWYYYAACCP